ncbi:MAG: nucleotidyltransferase [Frankiales bacterium]|nr:nucleotidyltransferase [Frankiales bacterium]
MSRQEGLAVVQRHRELLEPLSAKGFHVHGSLALGGYHHGISDIDLVVELEHGLTGEERELVTQAHRRAGPLLSAAYLVDRKDSEQSHPTWTHGWQGDRRVSLITRAELHEAYPSLWPEIPDVPGVVVAEVIRAWRREPPWTYLRTEYVDLALTSLARAHLTLGSGRLTSKDDAVGHLPQLVSARLATQVADRRQGGDAPRHNRISRAATAWWTVRQLLRGLSAKDQPESERT